MSKVTLSVGYSRLILKEGIQGIRKAKNRSIHPYVRILRMSITQKSPWAKRGLLQTYSKGGDSRHTKGEKPQHTTVCEDFENEYNAEVTL